MIKGAIFDFDGTLVDSMFIWDTFGEDYLVSNQKKILPKLLRPLPLNRRRNIIVIIMILTFRSRKL